MQNVLSQNEIGKHFAQGGGSFLYAKWSLEKDWNLLFPDPGTVTRASGCFAFYYTIYWIQCTIILLISTIPIIDHRWCYIWIL